jgi:hypothetical protein
MKQIHCVAVGVMSACLVSAAAGQAPFTAGNLVVVRVGTGASSLTNAATAVFLEEFTPQGVHVQTIPLPTTPTTAGNRALTISGTATSEGFLARSTDGRYLTMGGYNAAVGTAGVASTTSPGVSRVVARIAADGAVDTTTAFSDSTFSGSNIRSAITTDGTSLWIAGTAGAVANGGVRYALLGGDTSLQLSSAPTNTRVVKIFHDQLYVSTSSAGYRGVNIIGAGLATAPGQTTTLLPGLDTLSVTAGSYDFFFADPATLYIADERAVSTYGGVQRHVFDGTQWNLMQILTVGLGGVGVRGLAGHAGPAGTSLFVTTADNITSTAGNRLMMIVDQGGAAEFVLLATAAGNTAFRGIAMAPATGTTCYANCDGSTIPPILNVEDFTCFINRFAQAQSLPHEQQLTHYANCDGSTIPPVLNVEDFTCFINRFAQGCP